MLTARASRIENGVAALHRELDTNAASIEIEAPSGKSLKLGAGEPTAKVVVRTERAWRLLSSLDEEELGDAFLSGEIDVQGSLLDVLKCRRSFRSRRGWTWLT